MADGMGLRRIARGQQWMIGRTAVGQRSVCDPDGADPRPMRAALSRPCLPRPWEKHHNITSIGGRRTSDRDDRIIHYSLFVIFHSLFVFLFGCGYLSPSRREGISRAEPLSCEAFLNH